MEDTVFSRSISGQHLRAAASADREAQAATGHRGDGRIVEGRWHVYPEMAAAGLWTTAWDLAQVAIEVSRSRAGRSNRILSQKMVRLMLTPQAEESGLGFFVDASKKTDRFGHGGADEGFRAVLEGYAAAGRGVAIMTNSDSGFLAMQPLVDSIAREYRWPGYAPRTATDVRSTLALVNRLRGLDAALTEYAAMREATPAAEFWPGQLDALGYALLAEKRVGDAIRVFRLNVEVFPADAHAHGSLGEAYVAAGMHELAVASYRRSLELDPTNQGAATMLRKLGGV
jgi:tetratricopeptide (TPR) repeat protein